MKNRKRSFSETQAVFKRLLYSSSNGTRVGLNKARLQLEPSYIPAIVRSFKNTAYEATLTDPAFPKEWKGFKSKLRLKKLSSEAEFLWAASVLSLFVDELSVFSEKRQCFEKELLNGNLDEANDELNQIEEKYGVSIWMVSNRLRLIQMREGLSAQKRYLEDLINIDNTNFWATFLAYYFSIRSEENVSLVAFEDEIQNLVDNEAVGDYMVYQLIPYYLTQIKDPSSILNHVEAKPIIDRYEAFVSMASLSISRGELPKKAYLRTALGLLKNISDRRIQRMLALMDGNDRRTLKDPSIAVLDEYTEGKYEAILQSDTDYLEVVARSRLLLGWNQEEGDGSLKEQIISSMMDVLQASANYYQSALRLKKIALFCSHQDVSHQLSVFVNKENDFPIRKSSDIELLASMYNPLNNSWSMQALKEITGSEEIVQAVLAENQASSSLNLHAVFGQSHEVGRHMLSKISMPSHRRLMYEGHLALLHNQLDDAVSRYSSVAESDNQYISLAASSFLCRALFIKKDVISCLELVVDRCLVNQNYSELYPLESITTACMKIPDLKRSLALAILMHITSRQVHKQWELGLSDVFENIVFSLGLEKITQIESHIEEIGLARVVYFLRYICIPRILDDTTMFDSVSDIEKERISICQLLIKIDEKNADVYSSEIKTIIRSENIAQLLQQVESSKVYVDEDGVVAALEPSLRDSFNRYMTVLKSPALDYQTDKISKRFEELLSNSELKNIKLPSSEKESLFSTMLTNFISQFALNPAYGLDTHLSTTIRHGAFEGHIRSPLAAEHLLSAHDKSVNESVMPERWAIYFQDVDPLDIQYINRQLEKFTRKVEEIIEQYTKTHLHIKGIDINQNGMFSFNISRDELIEVIETFNEISRYEELLERLFGFAWDMADKSMLVIVDEIRGKSLPQIDGALDSLISSIESRLSHDRVAALSDAIVRSRTNLHAAIDAICGWFKRPTDLRRDPFDLETAFGVALQQINNCYVNSKMLPQQHIEYREKIPGHYLDGLVEILFIFLQNIIRHSGFTSFPAGIQVGAFAIDGGIEISIKNELSSDIELAARKSAATAAMARYNSDEAMRLARNEGGSGLSKVWRILAYDIKVDNSLNLIVNDDYTFTASLKLSLLKEIL